jgi:hypothetical protein
MISILYKFCKREIYHYHYAVLCCHSNELPNANMLHARNLCSRSRTIERYFALVYLVASMRTDNVLMWICEV